MNDKVRVEIQIGQESPASIRLRQVIKERSARAHNDEPRVADEWLVTGEPGGGYPSYRFTFSSDRYEDAEAAARGFIGSTDRWADGPHLRHRTVTYTAWDEA